MTRLTFYSGINEIGGNKFLLEDNDRSLLLDFGFPYSQYKLFYEEYIRPRSGAGLLDLLVMGLLPPLEGIYREDLEHTALWDEISSSAIYHKLAHLHRRIEHLDGVLLSHAHLDHSGHIAFLRPEIPIFSTAVTAFIAKAAQDSGRLSFDQQVCYFSPTTRTCPSGWKQKAHLSNVAEKRERQFSIADQAPNSLSTAAHNFWDSGFWGEHATMKATLHSSPLRYSTEYDLPITCFPVDHSIPGACSWAIETTSGWVVYSGDLRAHGKRSANTIAFVNAARNLRPKALIMEGTNVDRMSNNPESEVYSNALKIIRQAHGLVIADFSPRDVDRLLTFLHIAQETGRKLAILPKDAYLLKTMQLLEPETVDLADEEHLCIYQGTTASHNTNRWVRNLCAEYSSKIVLADDVRRDQDKFILCFSFFDLDELPSIQPAPGTIYVYSSSEPHDEEQEIDFKRLHQWLKYFDIRGIGLPVEENGKWRIPQGEEGLHASGHACGPDLIQIVRDISPELLFPIHTQNPYFYARELKNEPIKVIIPDRAGYVWQF